MIRPDIHNEKAIYNPHIIYCFHTTLLTYFIVSFCVMPILLLPEDGGEKGWGGGEVGVFQEEGVLNGEGGNC